MPFKRALIATFLLLAALPQAAWADCAGPPAGVAGEMIYSSSDNRPYFCDDTNWIPMTPPGAGGTGCTGPAADPAVILYDQSQRVMQYCDGTNWVAMGPIGVGGSYTAPTSGLVGHWKLDETSGDQITDSAGSNTGTWTDTVNDDVTEEAVPGIVDDGGAIAFDGSGDNELISASLTEITGYPFTLAAWSRPTAINDGSLDAVLALYKSPTEYYAIGWTDGYDHTPALVGRNTTFIKYENLDFAPPVGAWTHIAGVFKSATERELYINGQSVGKSTISVPELTNANTIRIGRIELAGTEFDGEIDDARVYDRALSLAEIAALAAPDHSLVAHWKLDESAGANAPDALGNHDGTLQGTPTWDDTGGHIDGALDFTANTDYVSVPHHADLAGFSAFTIAAWINPTGEPGSGWGRIISKGDAGTDDDYALIYVPTSHEIRLRITTAGGSTEIFASNFTTAPNTGWHHVTGTWDGAYLRVYINGQQGTTPVVSSGGTLNDSGQPLSIGRHWNSSARNFQGLIDDVRVYNRALTAPEIQSFAALPPDTGPFTGPVAHWKFDEGAGPTAGDAVGSNDGTLQGDPAWSGSGQIAGAMNFNSNNDFVQITDDPSLKGFSALTISAWINPQGAPGANWGRIVHKSWNSTNDTWALIHRASDNGIQFRFRTDSTWRFGESLTVLPPGTGWHHVAGVWDGVAIRLYVDGVYEHDSFQTTFGSPLGDNNSDLAIGRHLLSNTRNFNGLIDDVRIYDRALSFREIEALATFCSSPVRPQGTMLYSTDNDVMQYCNGADWVRMGK